MSTDSLLTIQVVRVITRRGVAHVPETNILAIAYRCNHWDQAKRYALRAGKFICHLVGISKLYRYPPLLNQEIARGRVGHICECFTIFSHTLFRICYENSAAGGLLAPSKVQSLFTTNSSSLADFICIAYCLACILLSVVYKVASETEDCQRDNGEKRFDDREPKLVVVRFHLSELLPSLIKSTST